MELWESIADRTEKISLDIVEAIKIFSSNPSIPISFCLPHEVIYVAINGLLVHDLFPSECQLGHELLYLASIKEIVPI